MKILIDGHALSTPQKTGKHFHTISLLRNILSHEQSKNHQFHILVASPKNISLKSKKLIYLKARSGLSFYLDFINIQKDYDLIISPTSYIPPLLTAKACLTFIYDLAVFHSNIFKPNKKAQIIEKLLLPFVVKKSHLITMTKSIKNELGFQFKGKKMRIDIIPGFSKFSGKINPHLKKPTTPYILFVGTNEPRKNLTNTLIGYKKSISQLKKRGLQIPHFYIVGQKGWQQKNLKNIATKLNIGKFVKIMGYVSDKKLSHLYQNCLFVTYIPFYEGFGLPVIEALAHNKSVLTSNQSTLREVLGPCGITSNPTDINKISNSINRLTSDPHLRKTYEKKAESWIRNYSPQKSSGAFYKILEKYS